MRPVPASHADWACEIAAAYRQALQTLPFMVRLRYPDAERDLYHLAPAACLRARAITDHPSLDRATNAALRHHIETFGAAATPPPPPERAFATAYLTAHLGLGLIDAAMVQDVLEFLANDEGSALFRSQRAGST